MSFAPQTPLTCQHILVFYVVQFRWRSTHEGISFVQRHNKVFYLTYIWLKPSQTCISTIPFKLGTPYPIRSAQRLKRISISPRSAFIFLRAKPYSLYWKWSRSFLMFLRPASTSHTKASTRHPLCSCLSRIWWTFGLTRDSERWVGAPHLFEKLAFSPYLLKPFRSLLHMNIAQRTYGWIFKAFLDTIFDLSSRYSVLCYSKRVIM